MLLTQQQQALLAEICADVEETALEIRAKDRTGKVKEELFPLIEQMTADINAIPHLPTMPDQSCQLIRVIFQWREMGAKHFALRKHYFKEEKQ